METRTTAGAVAPPGVGPDRMSGPKEERPLPPNPGAALPKEAEEIPAGRPVVELRNLTFRYSGKEAVRGVSLTLNARRITALIGPSGCGKSTLLRCLNRMNDLIDGVSHDGEILLDGENVHDPSMDVTELRKRVGMVFQKSNPFPKSIYENVAYGPRLHGMKSRRRLDEVVERSLRRAALWDDIKDRLGDSALGLSGGQQQRLCIARAIAVEPEVLLLDEPCSALDPVATARIEELLLTLKSAYTIIIVTHNIQQAARVSDETAFMLMGSLVEAGPTRRLFTQPKDDRTEAFVSGRFG